MPGLLWFSTGLLLDFKFHRRHLKKHLVMFHSLHVYTLLHSALPSRPLWTHYDSHKAHIISIIYRVTCGTDRQFILTIQTIHTQYIYICFTCHVLYDMMTIIIWMSMRRLVWESRELKGRVIYNKLYFVICLLVVINHINITVFNSCFPLTVTWIGQ